MGKCVRDLLYSTFLSWNVIGMDDIEVEIGIIWCKFLELAVTSTRE